jgi:molybdopterin biosynthesis enzyme
VSALTGARPPEPATATLLRKVTAIIGVSDVVFVRRAAEGIEPLGGVDLALSRLAEADGAILVEPEREGYPEGATCEVLPL